MVSNVFLRIIFYVILTPLGLVFKMMGRDPLVLKKQQAATYWIRIEQQFSAAERGYVWGQLAQSAAMRHDAEAPAWFAKARDLSDTQLGWKARAALRARNWPDVQAAIDAMTPREREQSSWKYWKARALKAVIDRTYLLQQIVEAHGYVERLHTVGQGEPGEEAAQRPRPLDTLRQLSCSWCNRAADREL